MCVSLVWVCLIGSRHVKLCRSVRAPALCRFASEPVWNRERILSGACTMVHSPNHTCESRELCALWLPSKNAILQLTYMQFGKRAAVTNARWEICHLWCVCVLMDSISNQRLAGTGWSTWLTLDKGLFCAQLFCLLLVPRTWTFDWHWRVSMHFIKAIFW